MHSATAGSTDAGSGAPVWVLLGHKAGDNHQVLALAESLGVPFERRELRYRPTELASNVLLGPNLAGLEADCRSSLAAPWPRLVITSGRRNEPVARWIRQQADHPVAGSARARNPPWLTTRSSRATKVVADGA